jgi:hypothetical protein
MLDLIKFKNFSFEDDTTKRIKQATGQEKIFAKYISDKGLLSNIHIDGIEVWLN